MVVTVAAVKHGEEFVDPVDGTRWHVDGDFLASNWECSWGSGCQGILDHRSEDLQQGCCSVGAQLLDEDEAMLVAAMAAMVDPSRFQHHREAQAGNIFANSDRSATRLVDGACIFLNRPGFEGGPGCALHLEAEALGEAPMDWKPAICWQLPLKVEHHGDGSKTLRRWARQDWGAGGERMAWCCTEGTDCHTGDRAVVNSLGAEVRALVGPEVFVELRRRYGGADQDGSDN